MGIRLRANPEMGFHSQADTKGLRQWQLRWLPRASEMHSLKLSIGDILLRSNLHFQRGRTPGLPQALGSKTEQLITDLRFVNPTQ